MIFSTNMQLVAKKNIITTTKIILMGKTILYTSSIDQQYIKI